MPPAPSGAWMMYGPSDCPGESDIRANYSGAVKWRSEDRLQYHPAVRDERHKKPEHAAHDDGPNLPVLGVHPDEHEALDRQDCGGHHRERRPPGESGRDDQPDDADEFDDAESHPGFPRQRTKRRDLLADLVEHEDFHDARRSVHERREDLQDPQQDVHRVPHSVSAAPSYIRVVQSTRVIRFCGPAATGEWVLKYSTSASMS